MADITVNEFRESFPQFDATTTDAVLARLIPDAYAITDVRRNATLYCIAHLAVLESEAGTKPDGGSGVIVEETIGPRKVLYANQVLDGDPRVFLVTTFYGRRVLELESRCVAAAVSVVDR